MSGEGGRKIAIIGGGITGLSAAYELERSAEEDGAPLSVDLYEAADRLGGSLHTVRDGPFLLDAGPDSLLTTKPWAIELVGDLGLGSQLIPTDDVYRGVFLFSRGKLRPMMFGSRAPFLEMMVRFVTSGVMSWPGLVRMGADLFLPGAAGAAGAADQTLSEFFGPRLGREAVDRLIDPFMAGIYGGDPARLSLAGTFPRFMELARRHRSLLIAIMKRRAEEGRSGPLFKTLRGGMGALIEALRGRMRRTTPLVGCAVNAIERKDGLYELKTAAGPRGEYDGVLIATPAHMAARLIRPLASDLAARLQTIRYVSSATVFFAFKLTDLDQRPRGHGFLVPRCEGRRINGATWISNKYPGRSPEDSFLVRCFVGGDRTPAELEKDDEELASSCLDELGAIAGIRARPLFSRVFRWQRANPQYEVGHTDKVSGIEAAAAAHPGLWLAGNAYRGIGIPDCVRDGRIAGRAAFEYVRQVAAP